MDRHDRIRRGGNVKRWHTTPVHNHQSVAAHSWGVAAILLEIAGSQLSVPLLEAAIYHDIAEYDTGDIPAQVKWANPDICKALDRLEKVVEKELAVDTSLSDVQIVLLKTADLLELCWFCLEERRMGNKNMDEIMSRVDENMLKRLQVLGHYLGHKASQMYGTIKQEYDACL